MLYPFFGNVLVGSPDLAQPDPDLAHCSAEETDYLLSVVSEIFPNIKLTRDDVILTYSGVRPLPRANGKDIGDVSRDHSIGRDALPGTKLPVLSLIGGKWTTFCAFSEQSCDAVLTLLGNTRSVSTVELPIGGGRDYPRDDLSRNAITSKIGTRGNTLLDRYGKTARHLTQYRRPIMTHLQCCISSGFKLVCGKLGGYVFGAGGGSITIPIHKSYLRLFFENQKTH